MFFRGTVSFFLLFYIVVSSETIFLETGTIWMLFSAKLVLLKQFGCFKRIKCDKVVWQCQGEHLNVTRCFISDIYFRAGSLSSQTLQWTRILHKSFFWALYTSLLSNKPLKLNILLWRTDKPSFVSPLAFDFWP